MILMIIVDVLVSFRKGKETFDYMDCKFYLEDLFGAQRRSRDEGCDQEMAQASIISEVVYAQDCPLPFSRDDRNAPRQDTGHSHLPDQK